MAVGADPWKSLEPRQQGSAD